MNKILVDNETALSALLCFFSALQQHCWEAFEKVERWPFSVIFSLRGNLLRGNSAGKNVTPSYIPVCRNPTAFQEDLEGVRRRLRPTGTPFVSESARSGDPIKASLEGKLVEELERH